MLNKPDDLYKKFSDFAKSYKNTKGRKYKFPISFSSEGITLDNAIKYGTTLKRDGLIEQIAIANNRFHSTDNRFHPSDDDVNEKECMSDIYNSIYRCMITLNHEKPKDKQLAQAIFRFFIEAFDMEYDNVTGIYPPYNEKQIRKIIDQLYPNSKNSTTPEKTNSSNTNNNNNNNYQDNVAKTTAENQTKSTTPSTDTTTNTTTTSTNTIKTETSQTYTDNKQNALTQDPDKIKAITTTSSTENATTAQISSTTNILEEKFSITDVEKLLKQVGDIIEEAKKNGLPKTDADLIEKISIRLTTIKNNEKISNGEKLKQIYFVINKLCYDFRDIYSKSKLKNNTLYQNLLKLMKVNLNIEDEKNDFRNDIESALNATSSNSSESKSYKKIDEKTDHSINLYHQVSAIIQVDKPSKKGLFSKPIPVQTDSLLLLIRKFAILETDSEEVKLSKLKNMYDGIYFIALAKEIEKNKLGEKLLKLIKENLDIKHEVQLNNKEQIEAALDKFFKQRSNTISANISNVTETTTTTTTIAITKTSSSTNDNNEKNDKNSVAETSLTASISGSNSSASDVNSSTGSISETPSSTEVKSSSNEVSDMNPAKALKKEVDDLIEKSEVNLSSVVYMSQRLKSCTMQYEKLDNNELKLNQLRNMYLAINKASVDLQAMKNKTLTKGLKHIIKKNLNIEEKVKVLTPEIIEKAFYKLYGLPPNTTNSPRLSQKKEDEDSQLIRSSSTISLRSSMG